MVDLINKISEIILFPQILQYNAYNIRTNGVEHCFNIIGIVFIMTHDSVFYKKRFIVIILGSDPGCQNTPYST